MGSLSGASPPQMSMMRCENIITALKKKSFWQLKKKFTSTNSITYNLFMCCEFTEMILPSLLRKGSELSNLLTKSTCKRLTRQRPSMHTRLVKLYIRLMSFVRKGSLLWKHNELACSHMSIAGTFQIPFPSPGILFFLRLR